MDRGTSPDGTAPLAEPESREVWRGHREDVRRERECSGDVVRVRREVRHIVVNDNHYMSKRGIYDVGSARGRVEL